MLTNRQNHLIDLLERQDAYLSVEQLSNQLGVSERTIYNELKLIQKKGFQIKKMRGQGVLLAKKNQQTVIDYLSSDPLESRRIEIMVELLFNQQKITYKSLSERYFVSQTSIKKDLEFIKKILFQGKNNYLQSNNEGTKLEFQKTEDEINTFISFNQYILEHSTNHYSERIDALKLFYPDEIVVVCKTILYSFIRENLSTVLEVYIESLLSAFIILVYLMKNDKHINEYDQTYETSFEDKDISDSARMIHQASNRLQFTYKNVDVYYFSQLLINYRLDLRNTEQIGEEIVTNIINRVSNVMDIDLSNDNYLFHQLKIHIPAMINRVIFNTPIKNPFKDQIKLEFSITYNVLWIVMQDFGQENGFFSTMMKSLS